MRLPLKLLGKLVVLLAGCSGIAIAKVQTPTAVATEQPSLLAAAFDAFLASQGRWAYVETHTSIGSNGKRTSESVLRIDPSLPYAQQTVPLKLNGQPPTEKQLKDWAAHNEEVARRRSENANRQSSPENKEEFRLRVGKDDVTPLLDRASIIAEDNATVTYLVPMRLVGRVDAPLFETFQLTARVNKQQQQFEHATLRQQKPYKIAAGTYSDGVIEIEFAQPDAQFPATPTKRTLIQTNKPLFGKAHSMHEVIERTDFRHVTPYDERFGVKFGTLRTLQF
ncbi:MAG: hypothetical protein QM715_03670 [Nibricoccus sp.]